jgi:hypothetical protein
MPENKQRRRNGLADKSVEICKDHKLLPYNNEGINDWSAFHHVVYHAEGRDWYATAPETSKWVTYKPQEPKKKIKRKNRYQILREQNK